MATRNGLRGLLERTIVATEEEARSLEKFKEQKMGQVNLKTTIFAAWHICKLPYLKLGVFLQPAILWQHLRMQNIGQYNQKTTTFAACHTCSLPYYGVISKLQTLDYNVRLADLQQTYARLAARTLERNTFVQVNKIRE